MRRSILPFLVYHSVQDAETLMDWSGFGIAAYADQRFPVSVSEDGDRRVGGGHDLESFDRPRCRQVPIVTKAVNYISKGCSSAPFRNIVDRFRDNWDLSAARAIEAFKIVSASDPRIPILRNGDGKALIGVSGYAETRPVHEGLSILDRMVDQEREIDRRIEVRLVMSVDKEEVQATLKDLRERLERLDADLK